MKGRLQRGGLDIVVFQSFVVDTIRVYISATIFRICPDVLRQ
jgi:hypothetical protein